MTAGYGLAGAPSSGMIHAVAPGVYREVTAGGMSVVARPTKGRLSGLSGLTRKCHGPFLGGGAAATPPCYPTGQKVRSNPHSNLRPNSLTYSWTKQVRERMEL